MAALATARATARGGSLSLCALLCSVSAVFSAPKLCADAALPATPVLCSAAGDVLTAACDSVRDADAAMKQFMPAMFLVWMFLVWKLGVGAYGTNLRDARARLHAFSRIRAHIPAELELAITRRELLLKSVRLRGGGSPNNERTSLLATSAAADTTAANQATASSTRTAWSLRRLLLRAFFVLLVGCALVAWVAPPSSATSCSASEDHGTLCNGGKLSSFQPRVQKLLSLIHI